MRILGKCGGLLDIDKAHTFSAEGSYFLTDAVNVDIDKLGFIRKRPSFKLADKNYEMYNGVHAWWRKARGYIDTGGYVGSDNIAYIRAAKEQPIGALLGKHIQDIVGDGKKILASDGTFYEGRAIIVPSVKASVEYNGTATFVSGVFNYNYTIEEEDSGYSRAASRYYKHTITLTSFNVTMQLSAVPAISTIEIMFPADWNYKHVYKAGVTSDVVDNVTGDGYVYTYTFTDTSASPLSSDQINNIFIDKINQSKWIAVGDGVYYAYSSYDPVAKELVYTPYPPTTEFPEDAYTIIIKDVKLGYLEAYRGGDGNIHVPVVEGERYWEARHGETRIIILQNTEITGRRTIYASQVGDYSVWDIAPTPDNISPYEYLLPRHNNTPILFITGYRSLLVGDDTALWLVGTSTEPITALSPPVQNRVSSVGAVFAKGCFYKQYFIYVDNRHQVRAVVYDQQIESFQSTLLSWQIETVFKQDRPTKLVAWDDKILALTGSGKLYVCHMSDNSWGWTEWRFSAPVYDMDVILGKLYIMLWFRETNSSGETIYENVPGEVLVNTIQTPYGFTDEQYFIDEIIGEDVNTSSITFSDYDKWAVALDDKYAIVSDAYVNEMSFDYAEKVVYGRKNEFSITLAPIFLYPFSRERISKVNLNVYRTTKFLVYMTQSLKGGEWKPVGDVPVGDVVGSGNDVAHIPIVGYSVYPYIKIEQRIPGLFTLTSLAVEG